MAPTTSAAGDSTRPEPLVAVVIACTRPQHIARILAALEHSDRADRCELVVVGSLPEGLDSAGATRVTTIDCPDLNPNLRRRLGVECTSAPIVAFIDDDAVPEPGWLEAVATLDPTESMIWTGPERPVRSTPGAQLAHAVASSVFAEGTRAHVDLRDRPCHWSEAPFCNLVTTRAVLDRIGPPDPAVPFEIDDFSFCRRASRSGVAVQNLGALRIRHDRYPDRVVDWLRLKYSERVGTGARTVLYPEIYRELRGAMIGVAAPPAMGLATALVGRSRRGRRRLMGSGVAYVGGVVALSITEGRRARRSGSDVVAFAATMISLHVVSVVGMQVGFLTELARRLTSADRDRVNAGK